MVDDALPALVMYTQATEDHFLPLVSIVIPVYNGANYLAEAIDSALAQTYENVEILVVNDGSNDGGKTRDIALSYGDKIRYFEKENGGVSTALNFGIREMRGDYFAWLSHDDLYVNKKIEKQINIINNIDNKMCIIFSDSESFFDSNHVEAKKICAFKYKNRSIRYSITFDNSIHGCSLLIPKNVFSELGHFNEDLRYVQDYDMWFRIASKYEFVYLPKVLVRSRIHSSQTGKSESNQAHNEVDLKRSEFLKSLTLEDFGNLLNSVPFYRLVSLFIFSKSQNYHRLLNELLNLKYSSNFDIWLSNQISSIYIILYNIYKKVKDITLQ